MSGCRICIRDCVYAYFLFMSLHFPLTYLPPPGIFKADGNVRDGIHYGKCTESSTRTYARLHTDTRECARAIT